ncbi:hypothetical protein TNCV_3335361 [Trichonephila clavipes]|nr:hypothetical protein TNCV_3335361 [Trichonephila clavipes]
MVSEPCRQFHYLKELSFFASIVTRSFHEHSEDSTVSLVSTPNFKENILDEGCSPRSPVYFLLCNNLSRGFAPCWMFDSCPLPPRHYAFISISSFFGIRGYDLRYSRLRY